MRIHRAPSFPLAHFAAALTALALGACVDTKADPGYCATCKADAGTRTDSQVGAGDGSLRIDAAIRGDGSLPDGAMVRVDASTLDASALDGASSDGSTTSDGGDAAVPIPCASGCPGDKPVCDPLSDTCVQCTAKHAEACSGDTDVCDVTTHKCVQCTKTKQSACEGDTPACDLEDNVCVECTPSDKAACTGDTTACNVVTHTCVECTSTDKSACTGDTLVCDPNDHTCVECKDNEHCGDVEASRCDGNRECVACSADKHCEHLVDTPVCDETKSKCVECTGDTEAQECGEFSCKRSTGECTETKRASVLLCNPCEADSECKTGKKCVAHILGTSPSAIDLGTFCFQDETISGCATDTNESMRPYSQEVETTSIDGTSPATYCLPATTCQAYFDANVQKACDSNTDCGVENVDDGYCNGSSKCTYQCLAPSDCPSSGYTDCPSVPRYCQ